MHDQFTAVFETVAAACCDETNIALVDCNLEGMGEKLRVTIFAARDDPCATCAGKAQGFEPTDRITMRKDRRNKNYGNKK